MISKRPWTFNTLDHSLRNANGNKLLNVCKENLPHIEKQDDGHHIVACVNAFHDAGIDPADLPKFVEAVRIMASAYRKSDEANQHDFSCGSRAIMDAAACLPENKPCDKNG